MRIISGKYRGREIFAPEGKDVRPTRAMVKEAIFGKIQFDIPECKFLDLFAGTGAMGIEALSRGAEECVFCDISRKSIALINQNLEKLNEDSKVINLSYDKGLMTLKNYKFDVIYIDPPYEFKDMDKLLSLITEYNVLEDDGILIYEHLKKDILQFDNKEFIIYDEKHYGITTISYLRKI